MRSTMMAVLAVGLAGCGYTGHEVSLSYPSQAAYTEAAVVGVPIHVAVKDDRDSDLAGQRSAIGAKIRATNIFSSFESAVKEMFDAKGYRLVTRQDADAEVVVRLRGTQFEYTMGWMPERTRRSTRRPTGRRGRNGDS